MRRGNNGGVRRLEDGRLLAVDLGADFTAEHEWGIKDIERHFVLRPDAAPGVPRRTMTVVPSGLYRDDTHLGIGFRPSSSGGFGPHDLDELHIYDAYQKGFESQGAWSDGDFGVVFPQTDQGMVDRDDLWAAFQGCDVAFLFSNVGEHNPFARAGLNLAIVSRISTEVIDDLAAKDEDNDRLRAAAEATGIRARIDAASKRGTSAYDASKGYYALRPRWMDDEKTEVVFYLNPSEQSKNNYGWFTVADLDAWLRGEGPVVKSGPTR